MKKHAGAQTTDAKYTCGSTVLLSKEKSESVPEATAARPSVCLRIATALDSSRSDVRRRSRELEQLYGKCESAYERGAILALLCEGHLTPP